MHACYVKDTISLCPQVVVPLCEEVLCEWESVNDHDVVNVHVFWCVCGSKIPVIQSICM